MFIKKLSLALLSLSTLSLLACGPWNKEPVNSGLAYFEVTFEDGVEIGTPEKPVEKADIYDFYINIKAMDYNHNFMEDYNGKVEIKPFAATLTSYTEIELQNGRADYVKVSLQYAADHEVISVHELESIEDDDGIITTKPTGKVGVSPKIYLPHISIRQIQSEHDGQAKKGFQSRFDHRNLTIGNWMVVTAVLEGGFYVHELGSEEYGNMYIYSHSTPFVDDGNDTMALQVGTILESVNASVQEFFGYTEMSFPTWTIARDPEGHVLRDDCDDKGRLLESFAGRESEARYHIPAPVDITEFIIKGNDAELEKYEAGLVTLHDLVIDDFDDKDENYIEYSQYPLLTTYEDSNTDGTVSIVNGNPIMAYTISSAPTFAPAKNKGKKIKRITGILKQHRASRPSTWILVPRDILDIELAEE